MTYADKKPISWITVPDGVNTMTYAAKKLTEKQAENFRKQVDKIKKDREAKDE